MRNLLDIIKEAESKKIAIGHFNISEIAALKAIVRAAKEVKAPVIVGVSEGERDFVGTRQAAALIQNLREEHNLELFLNADHTFSLDKIKEAVTAGFDAVIFDVAKLPLEENIKKTKEVVRYVKSVNPNILVEGEMGYIGSSSKILESAPEGAAIKPEDLTKPEEAERFVKETGDDLLAPAVGNIHGMFRNAPEPALDIDRIAAIKKALRQVQGKPIPLVLHGGSGNTDEDFLKAINAGISIIHISTELRAAWRKGMEETLKEKPDEVAPYKLMAGSIDEMKKIVYNRLKLFNKLN